MTILELQHEIIQCQRCPRLVAWCQQVAVKKVARFQDQDYWGRPVPSFGDPNARLLIVGLAPAAHGGNRTGRAFTGDASGDWLFRALHKAGFATQPTSTHRQDGLHLKDCYISSIVRCAPPDNKPTAAEANQCRHFLERELEHLTHVQVIVALGQFAFNHCLKLEPIRSQLTSRSRLLFGHNQYYPISETLTLITSYHPSQRNTSTKRLSEPLFDAVFDRVLTLLQSQNA